MTKNTPVAVLLLALATTFGSTVQATLLDDLRKAPVPMVEFGSFKLEVALTGIKDGVRAAIEQDKTMIAEF